jgi:hypothetical protein
MTGHDTVMLFANERAGGPAERCMVASRHASADWEPMLPSIRHVRVRLLVGIAHGIERSATAIGRAGWLAPVLIAALAWLGISAMQG